MTSAGAYSRGARTRGTGSTPDTGESGSGFTNAYADERRAAAYADLECPGTYHLAYRDLPRILATQVRGTRALDFGCGTGRSTRFLRGLGYDVVGVDVSAEMVGRARALDPGGEYVVVGDGELHGFPHGSFDLVLALFTFDNIPGVEHRVALLAALGRRLCAHGRLVLVDSTPELYTREWASFSTRPFPENARAASGDVVRVIITDTADPRPVEDVYWLDEDYRAAFERAGLELRLVHHPLARPDEPYAWVEETSVAPWVVYVLGTKGG
jgi:SAM-dependent methyltransferase